MSRFNLRNGVAQLALALLVAVSVNLGCNAPNTSTDPSTKQQPSIAQQAVDHMRADISRLPQHLQDAIAVQEANTESLMRIPGVIGTGVGEGADGKARVMVFTSNLEVRGVPAELRGLKTQIEHVGTVTAMQGKSKGFTGTYRPVPAGVSIGNNDDCASGTLGCLVRDVTGGNPFMLSNRHVLEGSANGSQINQPGRYDNRCKATGAIGTNYQLIDIVYDNATENTMDAGIASYGNVQFTGAMVNNLYTPSSTVVSPAPNLAVKKVGRTTGLTTGKISAINVTLSVSYGTNKIAKFVGQIYVAGKFIESGDSGSLMVTQSGNNPVGLCFAGSANSSFANPIGPVLTAFGVQVAQN